MTRPIRVEINHSALRHNYLQSRQHAAGRQALAVIKADAYGHGALGCASALADIADGFALLNIEDAIALRQAGIQQAITLLEGPFDRAEVQAMAEYRIAGAIHSPHQIAWLQEGSLQQPVEVWLKINSGMNRLGFCPEQAPAVIRQLQALPQARLSTIMTHFATADDDRGVTAQWQRFAPVAQASGLAISAANSAAVFRHPHTHGDVVRPGITLYGCSPFADCHAAALGLQTTMTLSADIIAIQQLQAGDTVGYGLNFQADQPMRIGIVACGYADGYPRIAANGTPVMVDGLRSGTVGRVSMDMLAIDLSHIPAADIGSRVELWGPHVAIEEVAAAAGTIGYELMCAIAPRVPRQLI
ncbi:alanine racemase [Aquitalea sp.]|uniref:alanine racemase n=1 Tax=Aquitalea sp. TaxID=1872623 RepID=UPI00258B5D41|nr:alanine racemase [Aquitalea sp.]